MAIDPVCGMTVEPETAAARAAHEGKTYYFCSIHCHEKFAADPASYLAAGATAGEKQAAEGKSVIYTCPMHPEIMRDAPGECPIGGMALEPRTVALEEEESPELRDMTRRFRVATILAIPVFISAMAAEFWPELMAQLIHPRLRPWLGLVGGA